MLNRLGEAITGAIVILLLAYLAVWALAMVKGATW